MKEITVTLKKKVDFSKAKVGDHVFCLNRGTGKISAIYSDMTYSIVVDFDYYAAESSTIYGKCYNDDKYASFYFFNPDTQEVLYERPGPKIDWSAYKEKMIEVSDDGSTWHKRELFDYRPEFERKFFCWACDGIISIHLWKQARLIKENS